MKILILLLTCTVLIAAETRQEAELRKQLAAAEVALSAERARVTALQRGTQKLTEAVAVQAETSQDNARKIEAVADRIIASEANDKKLVETVKSQADATQKETKKLADVVTNQSATITYAIKDQAKQQQMSLAAAREVARKLEIANRVLTDRNEASRLAEQETRLSLDKMNAKLAEWKQNADIAAAKDEANLRLQRYKLISDLATPFIGGVCGVLLAYMAYMTKKAETQNKAMYSVVNGRHTEALQKIEKRDEIIQRQDEEISRLRGGRDDGHPST